MLYPSSFPPAVDQLSSTLPLNSLTHIVITNLDPKSIPTLEAVCARSGRAGASITVVASAPALALLQAAWGKGCCCCAQPAIGSSS